MSMPTGGPATGNGSKSFSTGALVADSIIIAFPHDEKTYLTALPRETPGLRPNDDWDNIGQRLTVSGTVSFDNVAVPEDALIGDAIGHDTPPSPRATIFIPLVQAVFAHFYLGIAEGALNAAARYTREQGRAWFKSGLTAATDDPIIQVQYGELVAELAASLALARVVGDRLQEALDRGVALTADERAAVETFKSKVHATRTALALAVTNKIFEVTGLGRPRRNMASTFIGATCAPIRCMTPCCTRRARSVNTFCRSERQSSRSIAESTRL